MSNKVQIKVTGKNINRFIMRLIQNKIEILELENISNQEIIVLIKKDDYSKIKKIKSIYELKVLKYKGLIALKKSISVNRLLIFVTFCSLILLFLLSNIIFSVKVIHADKNIRNLILEELSDYGVEVHKFKKSASEIDKIKNQILDKYKDKIEWLEIENYGTSYIIRVEERLIPDKEQIILPRDVIAKKNAVILKIESPAGVIQKLVGNYVKAGDTIVSGTVKLNEAIKKQVAAKATVYGEVWYTVKVEYPYIYKEEHYTGNVKSGLFYSFLNKNISIFGKSYTNYKLVDKIKLSSTFLPIFLSVGEQQEILITDKIFTEEEALDMATKRSHKEISSKLKDKEYILDEKILKVEYKDSKISLEIFYRVCEDITDYRNIEDISDELP
jgi:similar to stage IV sporulation protein